MDQRPDPSVKKYFNWPIHKDPKGTVKARAVLEEKSSLLSLDISKSFFKPKKKKKKTTLKNLKIHKVTDEDFLLLESFLKEISMRGESSKNFQQISSEAPDQVRFRKSTGLF